MNGVVKARIAALRAELDALERAIDRDPDTREPSPWMNVPEYAKHARVSPDTVRRWVKISGMPATGEGRLTRINRDEADQWRKTSACSSAKTRAAG